MVKAVRWGLLTILAVMPFHAFLSVWLGSLTGHQALVQGWKEAVLLGLSVMGVVAVARDADRRQRLRTRPVVLAGAFALIALLVTAVARPSVGLAAYGIKTDLEFLVAFTLAVIFTDKSFVERATQVILVTGSLVAGFSLLQVFVLPPDFLTRFGYGPATVVPYQTVDPAIRSLRFASTLGGPNQLGTFLILPVVLAAVVAIRRRQWWWLLLCGAGTVGIVHTFSRSAWIGLIVALTVTVICHASGRLRMWVLAGLGVVLALLAVLAVRLTRQGGAFQYYLLHSNAASHGQRGSDFEHVSSLRNGLQQLAHNPLGHGLGTAGPATLHTGSVQHVIENNYLQIAYETGVVGAGLFVAFVAVTVLGLWQRARTLPLAAAALAAITGISVTALVLPAWTDSSTALTVWIAAGSVLGLERHRG